MYDLYIGNKNYSSWSLRPWVLMRELNIPFREILVPFGGAQNPDAFRAFSPTGKVPCLVDGATTVWDSLAITEYLAERHADVWPAEPGSARLGAQRCRGDALGVPGPAQHLRHELRPAHQAAFRRRRAGTRSATARAALGGWLRAVRRPIPGGRALFAPPTPSLRRWPSASRPTIRRWARTARRYAAQLRELPAMKQWYKAALAETWRDAEHEVECAPSARGRRTCGRSS